ncbi:BPSS1780 family membrane protein [Limnohabitans sp.]|uniref:BPSS1780 family membrane protein n=1 Tax=Limnohabitans sp. TaxID=1907725 RepID=UPI0038B77ACA
MKLHVVPARTGALWVRQGIRTFWKQPIALSGLFFMFMALMSVSSLVPVVGSFAALMLLPAASLGLMAATREVDLGKFPMPMILMSGFRAGKERKRDMLLLGLLYALGFVGVMGLSMLVDGGDFAKLYLVGGALDRDTLMTPEFQNAMWLSLLLYLPLSAVFWHAPALVHWHGVPALKSLFFSTVACLSNWRAFLVFGLLWSFVFLLTALVITLVSSLMGDSEFASLALLPAMLMLAAMFFCSTYYSFRDSFVSDVIYA